MIKSLRAFALTLTVFACVLPAQITNNPANPGGIASNQAFLNAVPVGAGPGAFTWQLTLPQLSVKSSSSSTDTATLGTELTSGAVCSFVGSTWSGTYNAYTNGAGNTSPLTCTIAGIGANQFYQVVITLSSTTAGSISYTIGGTTVVQPSATPMNVNGTYTAGPGTTGTGSLVITPTSTFNGTVAVSVKLITPASASTANIYDSTGLLVETISETTNSNHSAGVFGPTTIGASYTGNGFGTLITTGGFATAFGPNCPLCSNTTGTFNTAIGGGTLRNNTIGWFNTAVGDDSLGNNTTGYDNTGLGVDALFQNTTGFSNTALGFTALINNLTGNANTAAGVGALSAATSASNNVAIGTSSATKVTTGGNNTAIGTSALSNNLTGTDNFAGGFQALASSTVSSNVGIGSSALFSDSTGNSNVGIGIQSGQFGTPLTTGSGNTLLGPFTQVGSASQNFSIAIGYQALATATGHAVMGNSSVTDFYVGSESALGNIHGATYSSGANVGLTCSGTPTSSFASVGGIVTHC